MIPGINLQILGQLLTVRPVKLPGLSLMMGGDCSFAQIELVPFDLADLANQIHG